MHESESASLLGNEGPFATTLEGFAPRLEQIEMAAAVEAALASSEILVVEAGTGIGKTLAYLVPALLSGERVIISTGTKTLQDQLYFRDLPLVQKSLESSATAALLKGRANYLCLHRMMLARTEGRLPSKEAVSELESVFEWSARTGDGDLSISSVVSEESGLLPFVTSTPDNCLGSECPSFDSCFVAGARREAQAADVVVVNHHLLFADMAIKQSGFGEVLPGASAFIIDEGHQAPEIASRFFSFTFSSRQARDLCRDIMAECGELSGALATVREPVADCLQKVKALQAAAADSLEDRGTWHQLLQSEAARKALQRLDESVVSLASDLAALEGRSRGLDACIDRARALQQCLDRFDGATAEGEVRWYERRGSTLAIHITPMEVATAFGEYRNASEAAWIFTSATLAVGDSFDHFSHLMGLAEARTLQLASPFNYPENSLLWLPDQLPEPRHPGFVEALLDAILPVLEASQGRAFLLFTSLRLLRQAAESLASRVDFPLLVQGEQPRSLLLEKFRNSGNGVLLGSASFWEGVDVIGEALSVVVIDKLPFAAPDDPVMEARSELLRRNGGNPFTELYLPQAVISLKQGAGRLIRDINDRGVLVICDPRIRTRGYGKTFIRSLPPMREAEDRAEVEAFFT
jgi:ATP-dependent DNA helicase DinG